VEAEAREILAEALASAPASIVDLISMDDGSEIEFEPDRLGLTLRTAQL
jgi:plasmid stability protein